MTLSDLQGYSSVENIFKWDSSYSCTAAEKILTNVAQHVVRL